MEIRKSKATDLDTILSLYQKARTFMAENGNPTQWGTTSPSKELVEQDIANGDSYVCEENGLVIAVFYYKFGNDATYSKIYNGQWLNDAPYGVVHRITSDGTIKGIASFCLGWALSQCKNLRIDTHENNTIMQHMLLKNNFQYCGIIHIEDGSERMAYQSQVFNNA